MALDIAMHPWVMEGYEGKSPLDHEQNDTVVVDPDILAECVALGFREEDVLSALNTKQTNQLTSTYVDLSLSVDCEHCVLYSSLFIGTI